MAKEFITVSENDLGAGVDQQSAENQIPKGFAELIVNMDPQSTGQVKTRTGYQSYLGNVPVRVKKIEYSDDSTENLLIYLDGSVSLASVDLTAIASTPLIIYGKTSAENTANVGDFPSNTDTVKYYSGFTVQSKKTFPVGTTTLVIPQEEHGFTTDKLFVSVLESTSFTDQSNRFIFPDSISIDSSSFDITISYTNNTGDSFTGYVLIADKDTDDDFVSSPTTIATGTNTYTITAATHGLSNFQIIGKMYEDTGAALVEVLPDSFIIKPNGNVEVTFTNNTGSTFDCVFILSSSPLANIATGSVAGNDSVTLTLTDIDTNFLFTACYLEQSIGGDFEQVIPSSIEVDASTSTATIVFQNSSSTGKNFEVYYQTYDVATNKLAVDASVIDTADVFTDTKPQLTIWGLPHSELYGETREARQGWVNYIDSYKSSGEDRLICGLGGNLFSAQLATESDNADRYLMPTFYPNIRGRVASDTIIGPAFIDSSDTSSRTRGYISATTAGVNLLGISTATYQDISGYMRYRLSAPGLAVNGTLSTIISTTSGLEDVLTVTGMGYARLNGSFKIKAVTAGATYLDIDVENDDVNSSDWDDQDAGGLGGIFTDRLTLTSTSVFLADDVVDSEVFSDYSVVNSSGTTVLLNNITEEVSVPLGLRVTGTRTASVIPTRTLAGTRSVANIVRGDMLTFTGLERQVRVKYINNLSDLSVSITGDGEEATVTITGGDTSAFYVGQTVLIMHSSNYNGEQTILDITGDTTFTFASEETTTESATLVGKTINIDEQLELADTAGSSNMFTVTGRWIPIEAPESDGDLPATTHTTYFDSNTYTSQPILRSVIVQDSLYFTNGDDEVMKFDGTNIYRAGLPRWQPHLFVSTDTSATGVIVLDSPSISKDASTAPSANRFVVAIEDQKTFPVGTQVRDSTTDEDYIVTATDVDSTSAYIIVDREISGAATGGTLTKVSTRKYYFRLNMVDQNDNIISSAVTGSDDFAVKLAADAAVQLKLVGMPAIDLYNYDRITVDIFATKMNQAAPFYKLTSLALPFNQDDGYLLYTDTASDDDLINLDPVNTALMGAEIGTGWSEPLRAKYCTSSDNRLILANISDYPTLDLQLYQNSSGTITASDLVTSGNSRYLFRKDNEDAGTTTNMVDRVAFEFVDTSTAISITDSRVAIEFTDADINAGADTITEVNHGYQTEDKVQLTTTGTLPSPLALLTDYYIIRVDADTFKLATSAANAASSSAVNLVADGSGTHTVTPYPNIVNNSGDSFTVTHASHGLTAGDWVYIYHSTVVDRDRLTYAGWWMINSVTTDTFTILYNHSSSYVPSVWDCDRYVTATAKEDVPVLLGTDGNYAMRNGNRTSTEPYEFLAMRRMANSINAVMRVTDTSVSGYQTFTPWMIANAGNEFSVGQLLIKQPKIFETELELALPALTGVFDVYVNSVKRSASSQAGAIVKQFPSRLLASYPNFPEIFDRPTVSLDVDSESAVDINSADGQEATAIIPFFGDSAFGASQKSSVITAFKSNSVYLVDLKAKAAGQSPLQKLETEGKGCTFPFSVAYTRGGIGFANFTGIYKLNRDTLGIDYLGRKVQRIWREQVNKTDTDLATAHNSLNTNQYKLSVAIDSDECNQVLVYDHTREYEQTGLGSWTTYSNHLATGWANLNNDSYFATADGQVFSIRRTGDLSDYRDDSSAINYSILLRAMDFGDSGIRKSFGWVISHYRTLVTTDSISLKAGVDLISELRETDEFSIKQTRQRTGLSDLVNQKVVSISSSLPVREGVYLQLEYSGSVKDEPLELCGVEFRIAAKNSKGILQARETRG